MTSYLCESEVENLQNGDLHLPQVPDFGIGYPQGYLENNLAH